jgi:hypothetical protein
MRSLAILALLGVILTAGTASAAGETAQCTATEIVATNEKKGLDPRLEALKNKLSTPQFRAWDTFKLIGESKISIEAQKPKAAPIQYGRLTVLFKDMDRSGGRARLHLGVDLHDKNCRRQNTLSASIDTNDHLLVTGPQFQGGLYILALGCTTP